MLLTRGLSSTRLSLITAGLIAPAIAEALKARLNLSDWIISDSSLSTEIRALSAIAAIDKELGLCLTIETREISLNCNLSTPSLVFQIEKRKDLAIGIEV